MKNILQWEDDLKKMPSDYLTKELQNPSGQIPTYLVFSELNRRKSDAQRMGVGGVGLGNRPSMLDEALTSAMPVKTQPFYPEYKFADGGAVGERPAIRGPYDPSAIWRRKNSPRPYTLNGFDFERIEELESIGMPGLPPPVSRYRDLKKNFNEMANEVVDPIQQKLYSLGIVPDPRAILRDMNSGAGLGKPIDYRNAPTQDVPLPPNWPGEKREAGLSGTLGAPMPVSEYPEFDPSNLDRISQMVRDMKDRFGQESKGMALLRMGAKMMQTPGSFGEAFGKGAEAGLDQYAVSEGIKGRWEIWVNTLEIIKDFPLLGSGLGTFPQVFPAYRSFHIEGLVTHAENDFLQMASETGLIGMGLLIIAFLFLFYKAFSGNRTLSPEDPRRYIGIGGLMGILALLIHSMVERNIQVPANAFLFTLVLALVLKISTQNNGVYPR